MLLDQILDQTKHANKHEINKLVGEAVISAHIISKKYDTDTMSLEYIGYGTMKEIGVRQHCFNIIDPDHVRYKSTMCHNFDI